MELSVFLKKRKIKALVEWELEMKVDVAKQRWSIIPGALEAGIQDGQERGQLPSRATKERRKKLEDRLRMKDPW